MVLSTDIPGCRWPAEWEPHQGTWIAWPHERQDWPGKFAPIPWVYGEIVRHLVESETVHILVNDFATHQKIRSILHRLGAEQSHVHIAHVPTDRVWTRDSGPIFVKNSEGSLVALDWKFNAWAKYPNYHLDDAVPEKLAAHFGWQRIQPHFEGRHIVLEGGSIEGNGAGTLLTTEECLLSDVQARNPALSRSEYEQVFAQYVGAKKIIWLGRGIAGDDTHGHIDDLVRFVSTNTVIAVTEDDPADENYRPLQENWERLQSAALADGSRLNVVKLPMPEPLFFCGRRLPASYANFYIANDRVLVPTFNDANDRIALGILADMFPDRKVIGIHAVDLVWGLGTLHCLTQQQPQ
ncbi:MAG TPA: agmatine deiminase family protein [Gemmataceae bacterium]|jgi:agmatine deiminase|nr:agmatine deiminase family protein [Gemmataceae bacterium]